MLSQEQRDFFEREGYLVLEGLLDQSKVLDPVRAEYASLLDALAEGWVREGRLDTATAGLGFEEKLIAAYRAGCDWFQPMDISLPGERISEETPMHFGPAVFDLVTCPDLLDLAEDLLGPEIVSNPIQHVRIKPPAGDLRAEEIRAHITSTDWHQDRGVTHAEADATHMITVWCAVTDATVENGCLQVVPRAHREGLAPHCPQSQLSIAPGHLDRDRAVPLPVPSGGVLVLHPLTPHASLVNRSGGIRWSFDLRYSRRGEPTGRSHFPDFVARSRAEPESELRSWREWRRLWEAARSRLARQEHIDIHRWAADTPACA